MANEYQKDLDDCKKWTAELFDYANSLRDIIRAVNGKTVEQILEDAARESEALADSDVRSSFDYTEDKREALKTLRVTNIFAVSLLDLINELRGNGWYRLELGYLRVNDDGAVVDRRIANTRAIVFKTGERVSNLAKPMKTYSEEQISEELGGLDNLFKGCSDGI